MATILPVCPICKSFAAKPASTAAGCAGSTGEKVFIHPVMRPLLIKATGHGSRQMCRIHKYGFQRTGAKKNSVVNGFKTGDIVFAKVTSGKKIGQYKGRVAVRATGFSTSPQKIRKSKA